MRLSHLVRADGDPEAVDGGRKLTMRLRKIIAATISPEEHQQFLDTVARAVQQGVARVHRLGDVKVTTKLLRGSRVGPSGPFALFQLSLKGLKELQGWCPDYIEVKATYLSDNLIRVEISAALPGHAMRGTFHQNIPVAKLNEIVTKEIFEASACR